MSETSMAVATNADGRLELFALTKHLGRGVIAHKWQRVRVWHPVTPSAILGNAPTSDEGASTDPVNWTDWKYRGKPGDAPDLKEIAVAPNANGRLELFGVDGRGVVHSTWQSAPNGGWVDGWPTLATPPLQKICIARNVDGRLQLFGLDERGAVHSTWQSDADGRWVDAWGQWGGEDLQQICVANNADGRLELFALGGDGAVYHRWQLGLNADWEPWRSLEGEQVREIRVANNEDGRLELFALSGDGAVYHRRQHTPNGSWEPWLPLAGNDLQRLHVAANADGRLELFAVGGDSVVYHRWQTTPNGEWESWRNLGSEGFAPEIAPSRSYGRLGLITYRWEPGGGRSFFHAWQIAPNAPWGGWSKLSDGPPFSLQLPPPKINKFDAAPNDGYVDFGKEVTLSWQISDCQAGCSVVLDGRDGLNNQVLHVSGLANSGSFKFKPQWDTMCTLTASSQGGVDSKLKIVKPYSPPTPAGSIYYFKMTNPNSQVLKCFATAVYAADEKSGKQWAELGSGGYTAEKIDAASFATACG